MVEGLPKPPSIGYFEKMDATLRLLSDSLFSEMSNDEVMGYGGTNNNDDLRFF